MPPRPNPAFRRYVRIFAPLLLVVPYTAFVINDRYIEHKFKKEQIKINRENEAIVSDEKKKSQK